ncbi:hypothetical protein STVA_04410 [Allostella vacuolata]|nr:hypothetical protein STVA_04410 [Stella vacuolata]
MSDRLLSPISALSAWTRDDMARDQSWIVRPTRRHVEEIDAAVARVQAAGLRPSEFTRADFPLPTFEAVLADVLDSLEHGRGAVLFKGLPIDGVDERRAATVLWGLGLYLGRALRQIPRTNLGGYRDNLIGHIVDQGLDYNQPNVPGSGTSAEQMPHCDSSDLIALFCVRPATSGGVSKVASSMTVYNTLLREAPDVLETLYRGFYHDLRREVAPGSTQELTPHRVPVYSFYKGVLSCNFNSKTVEMGARKTNRPLEAEERRALDTMLEIATRPELTVEMPLETGDLQVINNYTVLHSRTGWTDADPARRRLMLRLWLKTFNAREVAPDIAGGYVTGALHDVAGARAYA